MTYTRPLTSGGSDVVAVLTGLVGAIVSGYGLLLVPASVLGGLWIAAIGLSLVLSGLFATARVGNRWGLPAAKRRRLSLSFAALAVLLLAAFVAINGATFEAGELEGSASATHR